MTDTLPPLREVISAHGLIAKKSLGQNFLLDLNLTRRIARAADCEGAIVYEVGPGPGGLTRGLLDEGAKHVIAVERDERCIEALTEVALAYPGRLTVVSGDAMKVDEAARLAELGIGEKVRIAANLPYNIGTALLIKWLTVPVWPPFFASLTLMFQREVGLRIVAPPGTEHYGRLSVLAQWRCAPKLLFDVARTAFVPPPKITSTIVRLDPLQEPVAEAELPMLEAVTAAAFGQRRKMLRQSLKSLMPQPETLLEAAGIAPTERPEHLTVAQFAALARQLAGVRL
ncbi:16S rRNA (adenine1518-N6/adenine1519-N6)-dimethyltransferase [Rhizomicrobium palustre]|uniref:Ribosomal RNA small subunit methyltransferase A n=1 Tax=Rhizomicrobium palustre TaxID=189966 RepID=A0A846MUX2_9PROT|nr:16S rRNA (adenine(1518)-N(6)/adenine(1519)-N(6))-dimethyltransferase RsmA [Rhizomicrobium palustre]NIK87025.1 16S rRNA (adenine1518-N6/adenine1519-N6)-dimethyltransferase [Rhizomicrobium palustre]